MNIKQEFINLYASDGRSAIGFIKYNRGGKGAQFEARMQTKAGRAAELVLLCGRTSQRFAFGQTGAMSVCRGTAALQERPEAAVLDGQGRLIAASVEANRWAELAQRARGSEIQRKTAQTEKPPARRAMEEQASSERPAPVRPLAVPAQAPVTAGSMTKPQWMRAETQDDLPQNKRMETAVRNGSAVIAGEKEGRAAGEQRQKEGEAAHKGKESAREANESEKIEAVGKQGQTNGGPTIVGWQWRPVESVDKGLVYYLGEKMKNERVEAVAVAVPGAWAQTAPRALNGFTQWRDGYWLLAQDAETGRTVLV